MKRWNLLFTKRAVAVVLTVFALLFAAAGVKAATFDEANRAYAEGRYREAITGYERLVRERGYSAPLLFNLGNAYFRAGQVGNAILSYERAQLLAPNDADIEANLSFARKQAGLFVEQPSWMREAAGFFSMNAWTWIGSGALLLLCAAIIAAQIYPGQRLYLRLGMAVAAILLCGAGVSIGLQIDVLDRAVITAKEATARISPFDSAKSTFVLSAGEVVEVERSHGDFLLVENRDQRTGWVSKEQLERVVPDAGRS